MKNTTDYIVIGSGIAGLNAALALASYGKVLLITKKLLSHAATNYAQGGIAAVMDTKDSFESHVQDTLVAGYFHNKKEAVELMVKKAPLAIKRLISYGVSFDLKNKKNFATSLGAAHSYSRTLHATDITGKLIHQALIRQVTSRSDIVIWTNTFAVDLIVKHNQCLGLIVIRDHIFQSIFSKAMVLATGGIGHLYQWTTNPGIATGDGIAIAHRAGAKIKDIEFTQFHPTALKFGKSPLFLLSEVMRGAGAVLLNKNGERFMKKIHPQAELAPRDIVARAIFKQQKKGDVYLDFTHKSKKFLVSTFPSLYNALKNRGFDLSKDSIPVTPAMHFTCGGVATDIYGRTSIKNLFAYGEVAAVGAHGANRLAFNSLLEGMVFPYQIEKCTQEFPKKVSTVQVPMLTYTKWEVDKDLIARIQSCMWEFVGIKRSSKKLIFAIKQLKKIQKEVSQIKEFDENTLEVRNMIEVALLIAQSAYDRKQSLGTHFITD